MGHVSCFNILRDTNIIYIVVADRTGGLWILNWSKNLKHGYSNSIGLLGAAQLDQEVTCCTRVMETHDKCFPLFCTRWGGIFIVKLITLNDVISSNYCEMSSQTSDFHLNSLEELHKRLVGGTFFNPPLGINYRASRARHTLIANALGGGKFQYQLKKIRPPGPESVLDYDCLHKYLELPIQSRRKILEGTKISPEYILKLLATL